MEKKIKRKTKPILAFAHSILKDTISTGNIVVDATIGNGHDTEFLASLVGKSGIVFGFDIQEKALQETKKRLENKGYSEFVTLFKNGHETIKKSIPENYHGKINAAIFNLGYLPGGDKQIITRPNTTILALEQLLEICASGAVIVLVIYHGHDGGDIERNEVIEYAQKIDQEFAHVLLYQYINQINHPPFIIVIEKR